MSGNIPIRLLGADYRRAHEACHTAGLLWNLAVDWVHDQWKQELSPSGPDIQGFLTALPRQDRPLHSNTTEIIAHDLSEAIKTSRTNRKNGMKGHVFWRKKNYRSLSFSRGYGWRIANSELHLSF